MSTIFSYPDNTLLATITGTWYTNGSIDTLQNLKSPFLNKKARSVNVTGAQTININLGATGKAIRVVAILSHNLTYAATVRARGYSDAGMTALVSGADTGATTYAFPQTLGATVAANFPKHWIFTFPTAIGTTARYWKIEITDAANPAGYVEIGRVWLGEELDLLGVVEYGASLMYESRDLRDESLGGIIWSVKKTPRRQFTGSVANIKDAAKQKMLIMQKVLGNTGEFMFIRDTSADTTNMMLESFPAIFKQVSALTYPYFQANDLPISCQEII